MVAAINVFGPIGRPTVATSPVATVIDESRFLQPHDWEVYSTPPLPVRQLGFSSDALQLRLPIRPYRQCASRAPEADVPTGHAVMGEERDEDRPSPARDLSAAFDAVAP
jgi:hypothetical protein